MKNILKFLLFIFVFFTLIGCGVMSDEEERKILEIEKNVEKKMISYLKENYGIKKVFDVRARFSDEGATFGSRYENFTGIVAAHFEKNGVQHTILCMNDNDDCYDTYSYESKVLPFLKRYIDNELRKYNDNFYYNIDYVDLYYQDFSSYVCDDYYSDFDSEYCGIFNNKYDVNSFDDIVKANDRGISKIVIYYNNSSKFIINNRDVFMKLSDSIGISVVANSKFDNGIDNEILNILNNEFNAISNEMKTIGNYIVYKNNDYLTNDRDINNIKSGQFNINIVENNGKFNQSLELYGEKYNLYDSNILEVKIISSERNVDSIVIKGSIDKPCYVVAANDFLPVSQYGEDITDVAYYAIYCIKE